MKNWGISPVIKRLVMGIRARIRVMPMMIKLIVLLLGNTI